jgi:hypothetical protein
MPDPFTALRSRAREEPGTRQDEAVQRDPRGNDGGPDGSQAPVQQGYSGTTPASIAGSR